jgi:NADPH2:quinone reductase
MASFRAFRIFNDQGQIGGRIVDTTLDELIAADAGAPGAVLIEAAYSSVNYKDALAATGAGKILRRFPLIGGIDVAPSRSPEQPAASAALRSPH